MENQFGKYKIWSKSEINLLKKSYVLSEGKRELMILPELLKTRTRNQCSNKAGCLGIRRNRKGGYYKELDFSKIKNEELAYLAGIIDGEGWFEFDDGKRKRPCWKIGVINTSLELLNWIQERIGGLIRKRKRVKKINGNEYRKQTYAYCLYGIKPTCSLLKALFPYLIVKRKKAREMLDVLKAKYSL